MESGDDTGNGADEPIPHLPQFEERVAELLGRMIDSRLADLRDRPPSERLAALIQIYRNASGDTVGGPQERMRIERWLREAFPGATRPTMGTRQARWRPLLTSDVNGLAGRLAQSGCPACDPIVMADGKFAQPSILTLPIDVDPWSRQSSADAVGWREAVARQLKKQRTVEPTAFPMCMRIVSVVPRTRGAMDVDNLVKGLLDALQGVLYLNDRQVQCLTSRRVLTAAPAGWYVLAATPVHPFEDAVLLDHGRHAKIMSGPRIKLVDEVDPLGDHPREDEGLRPSI